MSNILIQDFVLLLLIFLRIMTAFTAAPIFGHNAFPILPRVFLAFLISYIVKISIMNKVPVIDISTYGLFSNSVKEIIMGLIIGFFLQLVFYAISFAGSLIGFHLGFSIVELFNPSDDSQSNLMSQFFSMVAILLFFIVNGHHYIIRSLALSFDIVKPGGFRFTKPLFQMLVSGSGSIFLIALKIASPIIVSFLLIHIAEAIISKIIPQMQVFFVTQPVKSGAGLLMVAALIPVYVYVIKDMLRAYEDSLILLIRAIGQN